MNGLFKIDRLIGSGVTVRILFESPIPDVPSVYMSNNSSSVVAHIILHVDNTGISVAGGGVFFCLIDEITDYCKEVAGILETLRAAPNLYVARLYINKHMRKHVYVYVYRLLGTGAPSCVRLYTCLCMGSWVRV
jgi:hypothetical protein